MRTYGREFDSSGQPIGWRVVETSLDGADDFVWLTTLIQCLKLWRGESPFYSQYGIPAKPSVLQQVFPDYFVSLTQQQFAPHFASLIVARESFPTPTYRINVTTNYGVSLPTLTMGIPG